MTKSIELSEGEVMYPSQSIDNSATVAPMTMSKDNPEAEGKPLSPPFKNPARVAPMTKTKTPAKRIPQSPKAKELLKEGANHQLRGDNTSKRPSLALAKPSPVALLPTNDTDADAQETDLAAAPKYISDLVHKSQASERILKALTTASDSMALAQVQSTKRKSDQSPLLQFPDRPNKRRNIHTPQDSRADAVGDVNRDDPKKDLAEEVHLQISESHIALNVQNHAVVRGIFSDWVSPEDVRAGELGGYIIVFPQSKNRVERALKCFEHFKTRRFRNDLIQMEMLSSNAVIARFDGKVDDWIGDELLTSLEGYLKKV